ncbi:sigma-70 family RNA polymerase sigma factor [Verrucomicrobia bacterium]|nr:sigma-70 family RNA polymerase sigma factor [Verrucomicrobiota bacterium]
MCLGRDNKLRTDWFGFFTSSDFDVKNNDPTADFLMLYSRSQMDLQRYLLMLLPNRSDADDVMQETALVLWRKFGEYDHCKPFLPWAKQFVYFQVLSHRKKQQTRRKYFSESALEKLAEDGMEQDEGEKGLLDAQRQALGGCRAKLSKEDQELLAFRYAKDGALQDLAASSGKTVNALSLSLHRIRRKLLDCVDRVLAREGWQ